MTPRPLAKLRGLGNDGPVLAMTVQSGQIMWTSEQQRSRDSNSVRDNPRPGDTGKVDKVARIREKSLVIVLLEDSSAVITFDIRLPFGSALEETY
jgi:hypothetical protein